jgi:CheY-like chemotaxis protein
VEVQVRDSGIGISPENLPHIFERFRQADSSTTRRHNGLGLGLAIVRHITGLHDGTVVADSPGAGQGATFTVCLPYYPLEGGASTLNDRHPEGVAASPPFPASEPALRGRRVLVVDDEADTRELVASVLTQSGAEVISAASAREALERLQAGVPDAMLVDISMPGMDGYEFVRAIRDGRTGAEHVPAIAFTAHARDEDRRLALTSGFRMHVAKPVEPTVLVRALATVLEG